MKPRLAVGAHVPVHPSDFIDRARRRIDSGYKVAGVSPSKKPKRLGGVLVAVCVFLGSALPAQATTIVILITTDRIVIAADSRETTYYLQSISGVQLVTRLQPNDTVCKIQIGRHTVLVASGIVGERASTGATVYDINASGLQFLQNNDTAAEKYADLFTQIIAPLTVSSSVPKAREFGAGYISWQDGRAQLAIGRFKQRREYSTIRAPSYLSTQPYLSGLAFYQPGEPFDQTSLTICTGRFCQGVQVMEVATAIDVEAIAAALKRRPGEAEMVRLAEAAIRVQSDATPDDVGGPIDTVVIDKKGARWIHVKPECDKTRK